MKDLSTTESAALSRVFKALSKYTFPKKEQINAMLSKINFKLERFYDPSYRDS